MDLPLVFKAFTAFGSLVARASACAFIPPNKTALRAVETPRRVQWSTVALPLLKLMPAHGSGMQGTTRPTHHYVICDEIGSEANEIQGVTDALSYMFIRATALCPGEGKA